jgi:hypothetical protein
MKYAIKLTDTQTSKVKFLHSYHTGRHTIGQMRRARITTTQFLTNARKFATEADAQEFINQNAGYFGYKWEVAS